MTKPPPCLRPALLACAMFAAFIGCGGSNDGTSAARAIGTTDAAFARIVILHHRATIDRAAVVTDRAHSARLRRMAHSIRTSQQAEIDTLAAMARELGLAEAAFDTDHHSPGSADAPHESGDLTREDGTAPDAPGAHDDDGEPLNESFLDDFAVLGLPGGDRELDVEPPALAIRSTDSALLDDMILREEAGVRIARSALSRGCSPQVCLVAEAIVDRQSREIVTMRRWRDATS